MAKEKQQITSLADALRVPGPEPGARQKYALYSFFGVPNLYLAVWPNSSRISQFKMSFLRDQYFMTLGALGEITMPDAIPKARNYRQMVKDGIDPRADIGKEYKVDPCSDLIPVCPNCHAMLHKKQPPLTVENLKEILKARNH